MRAQLGLSAPAVLSAQRSACNRHMCTHLAEPHYRTAIHVSKLSSSETNEFLFGCIRHYATARSQSARSHLCVQRSMWDIAISCPEFNDLEWMSSKFLGMLICKAIKRDHHSSLSSFQHLARRSWFLCARAPLRRIICQPRNYNPSLRYVGKVLNIR